MSQNETGISSFPFFGLTVFFPYNSVDSYQAVTGVVEPLNLRSYGQDNYEWKNRIISLILSSYRLKLI